MEDQESKRIESLPLTTHEMDYFKSLALDYINNGGNETSLVIKKDKEFIWIECEDGVLGEKINHVAERRQVLSNVLAKIGVKY